MILKAQLRPSWPAIQLSVALAVMTACSAAGDGRYVGTMSTKQGSCGPGFDETGKARSTLLIRGNEVKFTPSDGVVTLEGQVDSKGHVLAGNGTGNADHKSPLQVFEGDRTGLLIKGQFASPQCRASVELTRR